MHILHVHILIRDRRFKVVRIVSILVSDQKRGRERGEMRGTGRCHGTHVSFRMCGYFVRGIQECGHIIVHALLIQMRKLEAVRERQGRYVMLLH